MTPTFATRSVLSQSILKGLVERGGKWPLSMTWTEAVEILRTLDLEALTDIARSAWAHEFHVLLFKLGKVGIK